MHPNIVEPDSENAHCRIEACYAGGPRENSALLGLSTPAGDSALPKRSVPTEFPFSGAEPIIRVITKSLRIRLQSESHRRAQQFVTAGKSKGSLLLISLYIVPGLYMR